MKKVLVIALVFLSIFLIYLANMDKKVYYLALGTALEREYTLEGEVFGYSHYIKNYLKKDNLLERYSDDFAKEDVRITDIINDIKNNKKVITSKGSFSLKNALIKADLVTISISSKDVFDKLNKEDVIYSDVYDYIDALASDLDSLFKILREYCKEDIIFIGPINFLEKTVDNLDVLDYMNNKYFDVCKLYGIIYVDLTDIDEVSDVNYKKIANRIIKKMNKNLFEA